MQAERKPSILEDNKFALFGKRAEGSKGAPKLFFNVFKGNVSASCFPNHPQAQVKSVRLGMSGDLWKLFVQSVYKVIDHEGTVQEHIKVNTGKPSDLKEVGTLVAGKDEEGIVYLALKANGLPQPIKFTMMPTNYLTLFRSDGTPIPKGELSVRYARGYFEAVDYFVLQEVRETYEPYKPQGGGGGQRRGGGGNWGNNSGGGWNNNSSGGGGGFDDIPL